MRDIPVFKDEYALRPVKRTPQAEREYELITPLFGGGVKARHPDEENPVRAPGVKGALRFWWRATRSGGQSLDEMRRRELEIFGGILDRKARPSKVIVEIDVINRGQSACPYRKDHTGEKIRFKNNPDVAPGYVAFPLRPENADKPIPVLKGVRFRLRLYYPEEYAADIQAALWAWEHFGGVGGRTRRGFGAFREIGRPETDEQAIAAGMKKHVLPSRPPAGVPGLAGARVIIVSMDWNTLVSRYADFRSRRENKWPEQTTVRRLARGPTAPASKSDPPLFPKAQLGLPVSFPLGGGRQTDGGSGENQATAVPAGCDRMASPLILRPLSEKVSAVVILNRERIPPRGVHLRIRGNHHPVDPILTPKEAAKIFPKKNTTDPLAVFLDSLQSQKDGRRGSM